MYNPSYTAELNRTYPNRKHCPYYTDTIKHMMYLIDNKIISFKELQKKKTITLTVEYFIGASCDDIYYAFRNLERIAY